jgi:hypothetical protein
MQRIEGWLRTTFGWRALALFAAAGAAALAVSMLLAGSRGVVAHAWAEAAKPQEAPLANAPSVAAQAGQRLTPAERKKQLAEQSKALLQMATELKSEVDKTNKDTLSMQVIRKAEELEKLAHSVRAR